MKSRDVSLPPSRNSVTIDKMNAGEMFTQQIECVNIFLCCCRSSVLIVSDKVCLIATRGSAGSVVPSSSPLSFKTSRRQRVHKLLSSNLILGVTTFKGVWVCYTREPELQSTSIILLSSTHCQGKASVL